MEDKRFIHTPAFLSLCSDLVRQYSWRLNTVVFWCILVLFAEWRLHAHQHLSMCAQQYNY